MDANDQTPLDRIRRQLAQKVGENAVFDGWSEAAVDAAAADAGIDRDVARLAFPHDKAEMVAAWIDGVDAAMVEAFPPERLATMKIREKIREMIWFRLQTAGKAREAVRSGLAILAMPHNAPLAARTAWRSADRMWRLAGDTATDYNHYSKRAILSAVYGSTMLVWLDDESEGWSATAAFLDRRIDNVMQFEKWKAGLGDSSHRPSLTRFLARLRYPAR